MWGFFCGGFAGSLGSHPCWDFSSILPYLLAESLWDAGRQLSPSPSKRGMGRARCGRLRFAWLMAVTNVWLFRVFEVRQGYPRCEDKHGPVPVSALDHVTVDS